MDYEVILTIMTPKINLHIKCVLVLLYLLIKLFLDVLLFKMTALRYILRTVTSQTTQTSTSPSNKIINYW